MEKNSIPQEMIPMKKLYTGAMIPGIGLGTFGSDHNTPEEIAQAVREGIQMGYRFIDCAACYGNEAEIGPVFTQVLREGLPRDELFVVSKVWNDKHAPKDVMASCKKSLSDLQLNELDCYLVHWPFPNYHAPGCPPDARNPDSKPYIHEAFMETWFAMESLVKEGLVRHIGTSNVTIPKLSLILRDVNIKPAVNEMELHPCFQQEELYQYCVDRGIQPIGFSPIGSPGRPERDRTPEDFAATEDPVVIEIAKKYDVHPAAVCLKWAVQRGQIPIPFSTKRANLFHNLQAVSSPKTENEKNAPLLTHEEFEKIKVIDKNCRLIKGQVFLWEGANSWKDLWDIDGNIAT